ncbi:MAG TPA: LCP family protein [Acidimicrobiia bacterium]
MVRSPWSRRRKWATAIVVVAVVAVLAVAIPLVTAALLWNRIGRVPVHLAGSTPGGTTYLLVGSDSRTGNMSAADRASFGDVAQAPGQHADLVLLLRVPDDGRAPRIMAVPRDLLVATGQGGLGRLGPTLNDGPQSLVNSLCRTLGVGVDHMMTVRFLSFVDLVDAVGGVDVTVQYPERDTVLDLELGAGTHHLDGRSALTYVRVRHLEVFRDGAWQRDVGAALGRGTRAQDLLTQVAADAPSPFSDPFGALRFAWKATDAISVDDSTTMSDARGMYDALRELGSAQRLTLPVDFRDGDVPLAQLEPAAIPVVRSFQGFAEHGPCADPQMPVADGTVSRPARAPVVDARNA